MDLRNWCEFQAAWNQAHRAVELVVNETSSLWQDLGQTVQSAVLCYYVTKSMRLTCGGYLHYQLMSYYLVLSFGLLWLFSIWWWWWLLLLLLLLKSVMNQVCLLLFDVLQRFQLEDVFSEDCSVRGWCAFNFWPAVVMAIHILVIFYIYAYTTLTLVSGFW